MTVKEATDKLLKYYDAPESWRDNFERVVRMCAGDSNYVSGIMLDDIKVYFHNIT